MKPAYCPNDHKPGEFCPSCFEPEKGEEKMKEIMVGSKVNFWRGRGWRETKVRKGTVTKIEKEGNVTHFEIESEGQRVTTRSYKGDWSVQPRAD